MTPINRHAKFEIGNTYHIYNRGNNSGKIFFIQENNRYFLQKFATAISPYMHIYAYSLMGNHFHFVAAPYTATEIETSAYKHDKIKLWEKVEGNVNLFLEERWQRFLAAYAQAINKQQDRHSSLFERRFKRILIDTQDYWLNSIQYTHHNPIHHHISDHYTDYTYSSYNSYLSQSPTNLSREFVLSQFGGLQNFIDSHEAYRLNYKNKHFWDDEKEDF